MADLQQGYMLDQTAIAEVAPRFEINPRQSSFDPPQTVSTGFAGFPAFSDVTTKFSQGVNQPLAPVSPTVLGSGYHNSSGWLDGDGQQHSCQSHLSPKSVLDLPSSCIYDQEKTKV